jgi:hypothetical protein
MQKPEVQKQKPEVPTCRSLSYMQDLEYLEAKRRFIRQSVSQAAISQRLDASCSFPYGYWMVTV